MLKGCMCGRFGFISLENREGQESWFRLVDDAPRSSLGDFYHTRYDIRPTQMVPVIQQGSVGVGIIRMRWGFHPVWSKTMLINSRVEGVFSSRFWKPMVLRQRCLVPASFFYEWKETAAGKTPYMIRKGDARDMVFGGIWGYEKDKKTGDMVPCFSILTQDANELMREVHNSGQNRFRQPVILSEHNYEAWLDTGMETPEAVGSVINTYDSKEISVLPLARIGSDSEGLPPLPQ